ncbi:MAG TPA: hypothetical protein DD671_15485 [Balneolaceae bacterium]|nr:hypothetical protein [Balneolaceae bacterium]
MKTIEEYDFTELDNRFESKLRPDTKRKIIRTINMGKSVDYIPDFNKPPQARAYYLDNFLVYVDHEDRKKILNVYWNKKLISTKLRDIENFELKKPLRISGRDSSHIFSRTIARVISKKEILNCLANGAQVKNFSKTQKPDGSFYVFYDRYYFADDVCVVASETKNYINVRTVYRTTPIADQHFLDLLPKLINELKINESSNVKASIVNNSARMKYLQTKEYMDLQLFLRTINGNNPFVQEESLEKVIAQKSVLMPKILQSAAAARLRCKDIEYYVATTENNESRSNINDFVLESNKSYSLQLSFDNVNDENIDKNRAVTLREYGIDIDKYEHSLNIENNKVILTIDFSHFSAAENPWAIRKNKKNLSFGSFDLEESEV